MTMYTKGSGKIEELTVKVAAIHGSTIVTKKKFLMPVSTPRGVRAFVATV